MTTKLPSEALDFFESAEQTITAGGTLQIAHGLGRTPNFIQGFLICKTGELGFVANDLIPIPLGPLASANRGVTVYADGTNLNVQYGSDANTFELIQEASTAGATTAATNANWRLILRCF